MSPVFDDSFMHVVIRLHANIPMTQGRARSDKNQLLFGRGLLTRFRGGWRCRRRTIDDERKRKRALMFSAKKKKKKREMK